MSKIKVSYGSVNERAQKLKPFKGYQTHQGATVATFSNKKVIAVLLRDTLIAG